MTRLSHLIAGLGLAACLANPARAQLDAGGRTTFVPYGGYPGGFTPYRSGSGFATGPRPMATRLQSADRGIGGMTPGLSRSTLPILAPVSVLGGMSGTGTGALSRPRPAFGTDAMRAMARPPVGGYPFRIPASLVGPSAASFMGM